MMDAHGYRWAKNRKRLLQDTCITVSKSTDKTLTETEWVKLQKHYRAILTRGEYPHGALERAAGHSAKTQRQTWQTGQIRCAQLVGTIQGA